MQGRLWRRSLIILFVGGLILCAIDFKAFGGESTDVLAMPRELEARDYLRLGLTDTKLAFTDLGHFIAVIVYSVEEKSPAILGYLTCIVFVILVPLGLWALPQLGRIVQQPNVSFRVENSQHG